MFLSALHSPSQLTPSKVNTRYQVTRTSQIKSSSKCESMALTTPSRIEACCEFSLESCNVLRAALPERHKGLRRARWAGSRRRARLGVPVGRSDCCGGRWRGACDEKRHKACNQAFRARRAGTAHPRWVGPAPRSRANLSRASCRRPPLLQPCTPSIGCDRGAVELPGGASVCSASMELEAAPLVDDELTPLRLACILALPASAAWAACCCGPELLRPAEVDLEAG